MITATVGAGSGPYDVAVEPRHEHDIRSQLQQQQPDGYQWGRPMIRLMVTTGTGPTDVAVNPATNRNLRSEFQRQQRDRR